MQATTETAKCEPLASKEGELSCITRARRQFFRMIEAILFSLVVLLLGLILLQVLTRYVFEASIPWTEEAARVTLLWTVMLGASVAMDRREHYAITIISDLLQPPMDRVVLIFGNAIGLLFLAVFAYFGVIFAETGLRTSYVSLGIPRGWMYIALPVGAALMGVSLIAQMIEALLPRSAPASGAAPQ